MASEAKGTLRPTFRTAISSHFFASHYVLQRRIDDGADFKHLEKAHVRASTRTMCSGRCFESIWFDSVSYSSFDTYEYVIIINNGLTRCIFTSSNTDGQLLCSDHILFLNSRTGSIGRRAQRGVEWGSACQNQTNRTHIAQIQTEHIFQNSHARIICRKTSELIWVAPSATAFQVVSCIYVDACVAYRWPLNSVLFTFWLLGRRQPA